VAGATYRIQVTGFSSNFFGNFELSVTGYSGPLVEVPGTNERPAARPSRGVSTISRLHLQLPDRFVHFSRMLRSDVPRVRRENRYQAAGSSG
jgi:hypothetical protein